MERKSSNRLVMNTDHVHCLRAISMPNSNRSKDPLITTGSSRVTYDRHNFFHVAVKNRSDLFSVPVKNSHHSSLTSFHQSQLFLLACLTHKIPGVIALCSPEWVGIILMDLISSGAVIKSSGLDFPFLFRSAVKTESLPGAEVTSFVNLAIGNFKCYVGCWYIAFESSCVAVRSCCRIVKLCSITASHSTSKLFKIPGILVELGSFAFTNGGVCWQIKTNLKWVRQAKCRQK